MAAGTKLVKKGVCKLILFRRHLLIYCIIQESDCSLIYLVGGGVPNALTTDNTGH